MTDGDPGSGFSTARLMPRKDEAVAVVQDVRHSELQGFSDRLGRVEKPGRSRWYSIPAQILGGAVAGAGLGVPQFLSSDPPPDTLALVLYFGPMGVALGAVVLLALAARSVREERSETIAAIKEDYDKMLASFSQDERDG